MFEAKTVDEWLDGVDYSDEFMKDYVPSAFALNFVNFVKLVNGEMGEQHPSPVVHLRMLDKVAGPSERLANLCSRGMAKTTLFFEYLVLYVAVFGEIEGFGDITAMIYVSDSMENGVKSARKNVEFRYENSAFLQYWLPVAKFTDNYLEFHNRDRHRLGCKMFGAKTGLRGTKIFGTRPVMAVLDDLVSDDDAKSKVSMAAIKDTVYKGVNYALDPERRKIIFNGTPFNKGDILYEAVESGGWDVNVWPICEKFPCTEAEFRGAWPERFSYQFVKEQYELAKATNQMGSFMQELMLRITNDEDRLVTPQDIQWYKREQLLKNRARYNFFMTSDWATSVKEGADWTVVKVWAINNNSDWFLVDGIRHQKTMDKSLDELFRLVAEYRPMNVGVEVTGQQGGFIPWMQEQMMTRNCWFSFATHGNAQNPGIRPSTDKLSRFNMILPAFKAKKIFFPEELRTTQLIQATLDELAMVTPFGIKSKHDDCLDNISQLPLLGAWLPSEQSPILTQKGSVWSDDEEEEAVGGLSNYTV